MKILRRYLVFSLIAVVCLSHSASAQNVNSGWWEGKVESLAFSYSGSSITFKMKDITDGRSFVYSECSCDSSWQHMCIDGTRETAEQEFALLMLAKSTDKNVRVVFNSKCFVNALMLRD